MQLIVIPIYNVALKALYKLVSGNNRRLVYHLIGVGLMTFANKRTLTKLSLFVLNLSFAVNVNAHMMAAQHGTLNIVDGGVFMVLSLPVSAFKGVDDDSDGKLSMQEFDNHRLSISNQIENQVVLSDEQGKRPLQGMILSPVIAHDSLKGPVTQLVVMGRFKLENMKSQLKYEIGLFGDSPNEKKFEITATRKVEGIQQDFELIPKSSVFSLFEEI